MSRSNDRTDRTVPATKDNQYASMRELSKFYKYLLESFFFTAVLSKKIIKFTLAVCINKHKKILKSRGMSAKNDLKRPQNAKEDENKN